MEGYQGFSPPLGKVESNVMRDPTIGRLSEKGRERNTFWTEEVCQYLFDLAETVTPELAPKLRLGVFTGARLGELHQLRVSHVNLKTGNLYCVHDGVEFFAKDAETRPIRITPAARAVLEPLLRDRAPDDHVLLSPDGQPWSKATHNHQWNKLRTAAKLPAHLGGKALTFHVARHTYCSHQIAAGTPLQVIAHQTGHSKTYMAERYSHMTEQAVRAADARGRVRMG